MGARIKRGLFIFLFIILDYIFIWASFCTAFYLRFEPGPYSVSFREFINAVLIFSLIYLLVYIVFGLYRSIWKFSDTIDIIRLVVASLVATVVSYLYYKYILIGYSSDNPELIRTSIFINAFLLNLLLSAASRLSYRVVLALRSMQFSMFGFRSHNDSRKRLLVIGAGQAASIIIQDISNNFNRKYKIVGAVDDNPMKHGMVLHGIKVLGDTTAIPRLVKHHKIDEIIVAIPSVSPRDIARILAICTEQNCKVRIMPLLSEMPDNYSLKNVRDVQLNDLLGRDCVNLDCQSIAAYIKDSVVLVTGGGGSIGSELCRQILSFEPKKLVILDIYENSTYELLNELSINNKEHPVPIHVCIASVRDVNRLEAIFAQHLPDVVFHAAAYKHVPLMEECPAEAVRNNVLGTYNVARCADKFAVKRFVMISTDKAVNPTNIMGATKRFAELIIQAMDKASKTEFVAVRFGNVLGSNGSVIPLFKKQIEYGGPVTVTHPDITRFFMSIPEAAQLVIQAGAMAKGGEIFILDMGEPVKILTLAETYIRLAGYTPGVDMQIEFIGLRPGEKLYEELLLSEEGLTKSQNNKIYIARPGDVSLEQCEAMIAEVSHALEEDKVRECMMHLIPTYKPSPAIKTDYDPELL